MIAAFRSLLTLAPSTDSLRSLALYITYAVNAPKEETAHLLRSSRTIRLPQHSFNPPQRRSTTASSSPRIGFGGYDEKPVMTRLEIGIRILDMYADLLCQKDLNNIKKFARTVTNKVESRLRMSYEHCADGK